MHLDRVRALQRGLDHSKMKGVEIGPFYSPVAPKSGGWNTVVVDFTDADELRSIARGHTSKSIRDSSYLIEQVDIVWRNQALDEACLALNKDGYDFIIASHVVEHIPNIVEFFLQASKILTPNGIISLALPDMRYCFDFFKPVTMTNDVLEAYFEARTRHTPSTIFQAYAYQGASQGGAAWLRDGLGKIHLTGSLTQAFELYKTEIRNKTSTPRPYIDAHAWIFTPSNFSLILLELNFFKLIDLHVIDIEDGEGAEFFVRLGRGRIELDEDTVNKLREEYCLNIVREQADRLLYLRDSAAEPQILGS